MKPKETVIKEVRRLGLDPKDLKYFGIITHLYTNNCNIETVYNGAVKHFKYNYGKRFETNKSVICKPHCWYISYNKVIYYFIYAKGGLVAVPGVKAKGGTYWCFDWTKYCDSIDDIEVGFFRKPKIKVRELEENENSLCEKESA